eukprot:3296350-Pleurochrysis_carterae.AAC.1
MARSSRARQGSGPRVTWRYTSSSRATRMRRRCRAGSRWQTRRSRRCAGAPRARRWTYQPCR